MDYVIKNGTIFDPESKKMMVSNIGIKGNKIDIITSNPIEGSIEINAEGLTVVPGFIDIHIHEDPLTDGIIKYNTQETMLRMGVTTVAGGNCGFSPLNVGEYFNHVNETGCPVNILLYIGYNTIRGTLAASEGEHSSAYRLGNVYDHISNFEMDKLKPLVRKGLDDGAIGLSFGLEYTPGCTTEEMIEMGSILSNCEKTLIGTHFRYDSDRCLESINESITVAKETKVPYQFSHIGSCAGYGAGYMEESLKLLTEARDSGIDIMTDCYPYDAFSTLIGSAVFDEGCFERWGVDYNSVFITEGRYKNEYCTREIFEFLRLNEPNTRVVCFAMNEKAIFDAYKNPYVFVASDGKITNNQGHPRGAGTFPRVLGRVVNINKVICFEEAIEKMTLMPANRLGFKNKGRLKEGCDADITIIDRENIIDNATYDNPTAPPSGIEYVFVNGKLSLEKGTIVSNSNGKSIKRQDIL